MVTDWVEHEFQEVDLGDKRLSYRLKLCVSQAARIGESTPDRARSKADLKATYRLVDNPKVSMDEILSQHNQSTRQRCSAYKRIYLVEDTTEVDLTKPRQRVKGAGPLGTDKQQGFFYHPLFAITKDGLPLGSVDQVVWTRDEKSLQVSSKQRVAERKRACFEEKESCRWLEMMLCEANDLPDNYDFIIRQCHSHLLVSATDSSTGQSLQGVAVDEALSQAQWRLVRSVNVSERIAPVLPDDKKRARRQARTSRQAVLQIRAMSVTIQGPRRAGGGRLDEVTLNVVETLEENPPEGEVPIRWVLLTTLPIQTVEDIESVLAGYCKRWEVELYFKTLKSGLKIEDMKYETLSLFSRLLDPFGRRLADRVSKRSNSKRSGEFV